MNRHIIDVPAVVAGEIVHDGGGGFHELSYSGGVTVRMPRFTAAMMDRVLTTRHPLHDVPLSEVSRYLCSVGPAWADPSNEQRRAAIAEASRVTGYSEPMLARDYWTIGDFLTFRNNLYDLLDVELGNHRVLDTWVQHSVARIRAFPKGRALHVLVGNVPMAAVYSVVRSVLTKNHTVLKVPSRDPISSARFVQALIAANGPEHPLSRGISLGYWEHEDPVWHRVMDASDVVCAWGQGSTVEAIKRRLRSGVSFVEFGPKRSFAIVFAEGADLDRAAMRVAHDASVYDQEACFSPQRVFVLGDAAAFVDRLEKWLDHQAAFLPPGRPTPDAESHVLRTRMEARFRGLDVRPAHDGAVRWSVVLGEGRAVPMDHPLGRTVFVHPIQSLDEVVPFVDDETQTISIYPFRQHAERVGHVLCGAGAVRVCECGTVAHPRQGFTHDGAYPLQQFVRLAYLDEELSYVHKYGPPHTVEGIEAFLYGAAGGLKT